MISSVQTGPHCHCAREACVGERQTLPAMPCLRQGIAGSVKDVELMSSADQAHVSELDDHVESRLND